MKDGLNDVSVINSLRKIELFAIKEYQTIYTYEDYLRERELQSNINLNQSDGSITSNDEDLEQRENEDEINRMVVVFYSANIIYWM